MGQGEVPPDECIELALWERFGWGPDVTDKLDTWRLRRLFAILEQREVSRDAMYNLGKPDENRMATKGFIKDATEQI